MNKALHMLVAGAVHGVDSDEFRRHAARLHDYIWVAEDGLKFQGYNGSQCWDTSFAARAMCEANHLHSIQSAHRYLERTQILSTDTSRASPAYRYEANEALRTRYFRHISVGGWPFSTSAHGWPISDCTSEALRAVLAVEKALPHLPKIPETRLCNAADVLLPQNADGGWATYENTRGNAMLYEALNPSETFADIMVDYSYVECSSASIGALIAFREVSNYKASIIDDAVQRGVRFIRSIQRPDGSWYGSWACCFCYGTWFGCEALSEAEQHCQPYMPGEGRRVLLSKELPTFGWGEDFASCYDKSYAKNGAEDYGVNVGIVQTSGPCSGSSRPTRVKSDQPELAARIKVAAQRGGQHLRSIQRERRLAAAEHQRRLQSKLRNHILAVSKHIPGVGSCRLERMYFRVLTPFRTERTQKEKKKEKKMTITHRGLIAGLGCVAFVQLFFVLPYYYMLRSGAIKALSFRKRSRRKPFFQGLVGHLKKPGGFLI